jgi:peroxiredoxin-like protein
MADFPHRYRVRASGGSQGDVQTGSEGLPGLVAAPPAEFGGPGDRWSPETLLVAAVATCFVFTFRAVARASRVEWEDLDCHVEGVLDKADGRLRFTEVHVRARLRVPAGSDEARARKALQNAEKSCLITNSLSAESRLEAEVSVG